MPNLTLIPGTLPGSPYCPASYQELYNDMFALGVAVLPDALSGVWYGSSAPTDLITYKVWARTTGPSNTPVYPAVWTYDGGTGLFIARHAVPPGSSFRVLWVGLESDLWATDGGDGTNPAVNVPSAPTNGAMWEVDHDFDAVFPIGAGALPSGTVLTPGSVGGEEKHTLAAAEMPPHTHSLTFPAGDSVDRKDATRPVLVPPSSPGSATPESLTTDSAGGSGSPPATQPHNNLPPYRALYVVKRTARTHYDSAHLP